MERLLGVSKQDRYIERITDYVNDHSTGLTLEEPQNGGLSVVQALDGKSITIFEDDINNILYRGDSNGKPFIQINFINGSKVLLTETLIGFKPHPINGLDLSFLPRVVTTRDLHSVFEALENAVSDNMSNGEVSTLKKIFGSIIMGGEAVGLDLSPEKCWPHGLSNKKANA